MDHIYALGLASRPVPTQQTLGQYRLAWVRGYDYKNYLPNVGHFREIQRREGILPMLEHDRVDFYIDALTEVDYVLEQAPKPELFRRSHLAELPLYIAFGRTAEGKALRVLFDQRMDKLVASGELRAIFEHWQQPYPFDGEGKNR
ncbi:Bacterial extracellular solute-binding protein, family 3 [compost metagenome]